MDCKKAKLVLSEYSLGYLSLDKAEEVRAHVAGCQACRERLRRLEATAALVSQVERVVPPANLWPATERRIRQAAEESRRPRSIWSRLRVAPGRALALAGSLAVAVIMFCVFFPFWPSHNVVVPVADTGAVSFVSGHASLAIGNPLADPSGLIMVAGMASREDAAACEGRSSAASQ
jgi:anti-sigma factor RsiW